MEYSTGARILTWTGTPTNSSTTIFSMYLIKMQGVDYSTKILSLLLQIMQYTLRISFYNL